MTDQVSNETLQRAERDLAREEERRADAFVQRHVYANASSMVSELLAGNLDEGSEAWDDLHSLASVTSREVAPNQYRLSVDLNERGEVGVSVYGPITEDDVDDMIGAFPQAFEAVGGEPVWSFSGSVEEAENLDGSETLDITDPSELEGCLIYLGILPEGSTLGALDDEVEIEEFYCEVYEHWVISPWLAECLLKRGEAVAQPWGDLWLWGRTTTGQAISMDCVIRELARGFPHA